MAAIRVYELARDLNMTNKVLLDKIRDMDISVKSHMSSLDEEAVVRIKANLFGKTEEAIVETRIKPTVIRRRRETVETAPPAELEGPPEAEADADMEAAAAEPAEVPGTEETAPVPEETAEEQQVSETPPEEMPAETATAEPSAAAEEAKLKKPARKRKKKEAAAKIIKLPIAPKEPPPAEEEQETARPSKQAVKFEAARPLPVPGEAPAAGETAKDARKKKKKRGEEDDRDRRLIKKKAAFRRKEIVEGAALYGRGHRARKGKKGVKAKSGAYGQKTQITVAKAIKRRIKIDDSILLADLAKRMGIKSGEMIQVLMSMGVMATVNQTIDFDMATLVAAEFNYEVEKARFEEETILKVEKDAPEKMVERPPVVTIMGHVDHGKTSLLDVIRETKITDIEAGGITQHIGAYYVETEKGKIAFLDTPGHEAFTAMRGRGAKVTDIVVLVVAADDGVMPQTTEAVNHARAANVPIIVAVNKIDKDNADPERVYRELAEQGLSAEEWGGDTIFVKVSAKKKTGISDLLEMILLQAEVLELKANPDKRATGYVVESKIDPGRGAVATVLVQEGTLKVGDAVVCGVYHGKVRAMLDDRGDLMETAGPSIPVEVVGLSGVPMAGDQLVVLDDEKNAKQISEHRIQKQRSKELAKSSRLSLDKLYEKMQEGEVKDLNLIIKADVHGSIEALADSLTKLSNEEVQINIVHSATGTITESDISLASVSDAIIIGFNVRPTSKVTAMAHEEGVDMRFYNVIYNVIKEVKDAIAGMMASTFKERPLGRAEVREVFHVPKIGAIAGCYITEGKIERGRLMRVIRDGIVDYESKVGSLRRFKDDVKEVQSGYECGIGIENYNDIKVGDVLECYYLEEIKPEL
ncbi:MAG: translation initiation factor IF-2 [Deltaproteobacteria bacterium SG8_13]|nr:MAG: translation initiation factor IF-2 [Deltaproteobacteria bacterium SG8_13]